MTTINSSNNIQMEQTSSDDRNHHNQALQAPAAADLNYRIGYWWSDKKSQRLNVAELTALFAEKGCQFIKVDLDRPLEEQGPFALIIHKLSDIAVRANQGDVAAKKTIGLFESYVRKHPDMIVLDPLDNVRVLLDRYQQYRLIEQSGIAKECNVFTPSFVHLTSTNLDVNRGRIRRSKITFPVVCKPIQAQGSTEAHQMCIIFNEAGLKDIKPPCVAQSFVNHNARLFKLFVIKDNYYIIERPSLKNFQASETKETVFFFSHNISKPNSCNSLTELDDDDRRKLDSLMSQMKQMNLTTEIDSTTTSYNVKTYIQTEEENSLFNRANSSQEATYSSLVPNNDRLNKIVEIFSEKLGLTFYGLDIIIENGTSRYAIIDMNPFPGYDGVENFLSIIRDVVCDAITKTDTVAGDLQHSKLIQMKTNPRRKPTEFDSGIEST